MYSTYQDPVEGNVYDYAALPCAAKVSITHFVCGHITSSNLHHTQGSDALLECYSAVDYYSTLNEYSCIEQVYDDIIKKVQYSSYRM